MNEHRFDKELIDSGMDILNFMASRFRPIMGFRRMPHITCEDGFEMSVQCGEGLYSTPRNNTGPYRRFEIGFPNQEDDLIKPYKEAEESDIYPQTDLHVILALIDKHGGLSLQFKEDFYKKLELNSEKHFGLLEETVEPLKITFG